MVEDNPKHLERARQWMGRYEYSNLDTVRNVNEAEQKLKQNQYDVVVIDTRMEAEDSGFAVIEKIKELKINPAMIFFTANDTVEDCRRAFKSGVWDYISKNMRGNAFEELHKSIQSWFKQNPENKES
ncbi:MAG: response regulator [Desulfobacterales bacterium]|nr:response regulator [Desulfobacterales bacterium]